ncbi:glycoside hydrolase family 9 protein [Streptomyces sp. MH60]|uniref:glycoside hydrolase family 9 protein n=1 Tax=Streptomyces sp. MH60 TaxID=1940758 RepID=UPI000D453875|nr:glycoside hydrolase family 9 protein [Streptomyces sp. MH60]PPS80389.1 Endoglucanase C [Streptomyces sp. MH60]
MNHFPSPSARTASAVTASVLAACCLTACSGGRDEQPAAIRVNQVGYASGEKKFAYVMGDRDALADAGFEVLDERGDTAERGGLGPSLGGWNGTYTAVRTIDLSALRRTGTYRLRLVGAGGNREVRFRVAPARQLLDPLRADTVHFFGTQRDGADVLADATGRVPSHLTDERARVYEPARTGSAADGKTADGATAGPELTEAGGPVDVSGGWFDAGDFLKFTHTTSYVVAQMLSTVRDTPSVPGLREEARHGLRWLDRMWDGQTGTLYAQVGLGSGGKGVRGDHDVWRLPEEDDRLTVRPGDPDYLIKYRPVFRANEPGEPISPNLAGRVSAAFALAAQTEAGDHPAQAREWLDKAAAVYALADTRPDEGALVTTTPTDYYQEHSWRDDLEWAAVELSRGADALGDTRGSRWSDEAATWARAALREEHGGTLGPADVSALAHADVLTSADPGAGLATALEAELRRQVETGRKRAAGDPFRSGVIPSDFDAVPHTFGLLATAELYARVTGDHRYDDFAARQRAWVFGANAWGTSFMVGAGDLYPHCLQHQVANLAMSRTGRGDILRGAVVNGPNDADLLKEPDTFDGGHPCSFAPDGGPWSRFDGRGAGYVDDVRAWQTVEPADDFTSTALYALSLTAARS